MAAPKPTRTPACGASPSCRGTPPQRLPCRLLDLLALAKAGLLDTVRVAAQVKGVMAGKGMELSEVDSILEWAWQKVGPEGLPHVR